MNIIYSSNFAREYKKLPETIKKVAEKRKKLFQENLFHPSLKTHKLKGNLKNFWSFSINKNYRIIFKLQSKQEVWFLSVGPHDIYNITDL